MKRGLVGLVGVVVLPLLAALPGTAQGAERNVLRVCADPDNRPFSNAQREGFENRIAEVIARELGAELTYTWWPHQRGLVRRTLNAGTCDLLIGVPAGYDRVLSTRPYYRTSYVIVQPRDRGPKIATLDDPRLQRLKIGVHINTPPTEALAERGVVGDNVIGYPLYYDSRYHPEDYPGRIIEDLLAGTIDVAIVWGPIAGYFTRKGSATASLLELAPLDGGRDGLPFAFRISMGVRKGDRQLKQAVETALLRRRGEIRSILEEYGVPLLADEEADAAWDDRAAEKNREDPGGQRHHE